MQQPDNLDARAFDPVDDDKRRAADHQLTGALLASWPSNVGVLHQHVYLALNLLVLTDRGQWIVLGDVVQLLKPIGAGQG